MYIGEMNEFRSFNLAKLKEICKGVANKLSDVKLNHPPNHYMPSDEEERDRTVIEDAVELLEYFSEEL